MTTGLFGKLTGYAIVLSFLFSFPFCNEGNGEDCDVMWSLLIPCLQYAWDAGLHVQCLITKLTHSSHAVSCNCHVQANTGSLGQEFHDCPTTTCTTALMCHLLCTQISAIYVRTPAELCLDFRHAQLSESLHDAAALYVLLLP